MKINGQKITTKEFAFDGCHKIYLLETPQEKKEAVQAGYNIFPIKDLKNTYDNSCSFKFIDFWNVKKNTCRSSV